MGEQQARNRFKPDLLHAETTLPSASWGDHEVVDEEIAIQAVLNLVKLNCFPLFF